MISEWKCQSEKKHWPGPRDWHFPFGWRFYSFISSQLLTWLRIHPEVPSTLHQQEVSYDPEECWLPKDFSFISQKEKITNGLWKSVAPNFLLSYVLEIVNNSWSEHQPALILTTNQETKICNVLMGKTFVPCHLNQKCAKNNN